MFHLFTWNFRAELYVWEHVKILASFWENDSEVLTPAHNMLPLPSLLFSFAADSQSVSKVSCNSSFLQDFVLSLINYVENPLWLFEVLQEVFKTFSICASEV